MEGTGGEKALQCRFPYSLSTRYHIRFPCIALVYRIGCLSHMSSSSFDSMNSIRTLDHYIPTITAVLQSSFFCIPASLPKDFHLLALASLYVPERIAFHSPHTPPIGHIPNTLSFHALL